MKRLTVISHTRHYQKEDGTIVGWGATVTEINHLLDIFDEITHVAMLYPGMAPSSALPYVSERISFVPIPSVGGKTFLDKLSIVTKAPQIIATIRRTLKSTDYFQFRAPTGIGVFVIPYLILCHGKKGWFKYAGNWKQAQAPLAYSFQKWLLTKQSRPVTINGFWGDQPDHCLSFENPCLTAHEVVDGVSITSIKTHKAPFHFCFVGRLEPAKGVDLLLEAFSKMTAAEREQIGVIHLVGDGKCMGYYQELSSRIPLNFIFHGVLTRSEVHKIYKRSHAILLPSSSEGFPKVIAEAMNYGCIPIVSDISSVGHYIVDGKNGLLLRDLNANALKRCINTFVSLNHQQQTQMVTHNMTIMKKFTYAYYNQRLIEDVL